MNLFRRPQTTPAFSLVEIIIVVAILGILALASLPRLMDAQMRAKIARVQTDMRTMAFALEVYCVDRGQYPIYYNADDGGDFGSNVPEEVTFLPYLITTPVAYVSRLLIDPFSVQQNEDAGYIGNSNGRKFTYFYRRTYDGKSWPKADWFGPGGTPEYTSAFFNIANHINMAFDSYNHMGWYFDESRTSTGVKYVVGTAGPSLYFATMQRSQEPQYGSIRHPEYPDLRYDPTNGTLDHGNILRFGP